MKKVQLNNSFFIPMPVVLVGTKIDEKVNFMTAGWIARVNNTPPMIGVGVNKIHLSNANIKASKKFSICFPNSKLIAKTDHCGMISGNKKDKSKVFDLFYGTLNVPMINECPVNCECELVQTVDFQSNTFFIGEIKGVWANETVTKDNKLDFDLADLFILTMPDNQYRGITKPIAKAWNPQNKNILS